MRARRKAARSGESVPMNSPSPSVGCAPLATLSPRGEGSTTLPSPPGRRVGDEGRDATAGSWTQVAAHTPWRLSLTLPHQAGGKENVWRFSSDLHCADCDIHYA